MIYPLVKLLSCAANVFHLTPLARFLHRPMIRALLPSFCTDSYGYIEFFSPYSVYWIAAYKEKFDAHIDPMFKELKTSIYFI